MRDRDCELVKAAKNDYAVIHRLMPEKTCDEAFMTAVCYHYQQAIEKLLKALIGNSGNQYEYTHDISKLCYKCEQCDIELPEELGLFATTLTDWVTKARRGDSVCTTIKQLSIAEKIYNKLLLLLDSNASKKHHRKN